MLLGLFFGSWKPLCEDSHAEGLTKPALQVVDTVQNFYLNQVAMDLANGDFNLTDLVPNGISVSDPVFFNNAAVNVSSSNTVGLAVPRHHASVLHRSALPPAALDHHAMWQCQSCVA